MTATKSKKIPIMEIFGPTIQGEGMVIGRKTIFIRTGGCDYSCAWCDSAFTWNGEQKATMMTAQEVMDRVLELGMVNNVRNFNHITISGGNPALIGAPMAEFISLCRKLGGIGLGLETQGTRYQSWFHDIDDLTISPKPPSSKMHTDFDKLDDIMRQLYVSIVAGATTLKVVVFDDEDFEFAKKVHKRYPHVPFYLSVGNEDAKEEGDISGRLLHKLNWLWDKVLSDPEMNSVRPLPQLHTLVWANKRGV